MPKRHCSVKNLAIAFLAGITVPALPLYAQTLTQNTPLTFGTVVMHNNSSQRDITLLPGGGYTADPGYYFFGGDEPQMGSYRIEGQTPNAIMDIAINTGGTTLTGGSTGYFTLVDPFTVPAVVITNGSGDADFQVGATLRSNGGGGTFNDTGYSDQFTITVTPQ